MARIRTVDVSTFRIPTDAPESDGTLEWAITTLVVVEISDGGTRGLGYTYADGATAAFIHEHLTQAIVEGDPMDVPAAWSRMVHVIRNLGRPGVSSMAISAVDVALHDLKARLLNIPLVTLLGRAREGVEVYGSGGFTSYSDDELRSQLGGWARQGITRVKMKIGRDPARDPARIRAARDAIGNDVALFVDANGALSRKQALALADEMSAFGVRWFEEPVSSDDLEGLHLLRDRAPAGMDVAAGEYGYDLFYFQRMLAAQAVDVLQADASRCGGVTGFLRVAALCEANSIPLSAHCAPQLHLHAACALPNVRHLEYFHDHARIERMLFDGTSVPDHGVLRPDMSRPGIGIDLKRADAARFSSAPT